MSQEYSRCEVFSAFFIYLFLINNEKCLFVLVKWHRELNQTINRLLEHDFRVQLSKPHWNVLGSGNTRSGTSLSRPVCPCVRTVGFPCVVVISTGINTVVGVTGWAVRKVACFSTTSYLYYSCTVLRRFVRIYGRTSSRNGNRTRLNK